MDGMWMVNAMSAPGSGLLAVGRLPTRMTQCEFSAQALHTHVSPGLLIATTSSVPSYDIG